MAQLAGKTGRTGDFPVLNVARQLSKWLLVGTLYVVLVGLFSRFVWLPQWSVGDEAAAIPALALGILVAFRTNTAYDRWWEARKLWGQLVNETRNLTLKARAHDAVGDDQLRALDRLLIAFPHALRLHLRGQDDLQLVPGFAGDTSGFPHPPGYIAGAVHQLLNRWNRAGQLADTVWVLDVHARALLEICGACERIRNTPLASSYRSIVRWSIICYVALAPWSVSLDTGWVALPVVVLAFAFLFGVELTAEVVEEPFGAEADDLPLDHLCEIIERFICAAAETEFSPDQANPAES